MKNSAKLLITLVVAAFVAACSGPSQDEGVGQSSAALDLPGQLAVPTDWNGSAIDLYVADAWASCSAVAPPATTAPKDFCSIMPAATHDRYLEWVLQQMGISASACEKLPSATYTAKQTECNNNNNVALDSQNVLRHWVWMRSADDCNSVTTSTTTTPKAAPLTLERMPGVITSLSAVPSAQTIEADDIVRTPGINLCIAQRLRTLAPGSAGATTLTLSAADQRELVSLTRDRAQMAVMGYARLARLLTTQQPQVPPSTSLEAVQDWFKNLNSATFPNELGDDMASAVQLYTVSAADLLDLLSRSASANIPWGAPSGTNAIDRQFGFGSWRARALAELFGGDPLSAGKDTPWRHFSPDGFSPNSFTSGGGFAVPDHAAVDVREPQVDELFQLAKRYDVVDLRETVHLPSGVHTVDVATAANRLYRAVEAGLRTSDCTVEVAKICQPVAPEDVEDPTIGVGGFILWNASRITLEHATQLVRLLADEIGYIQDVTRGNDSWTHEANGSADVLGAKSIVTKTAGPDKGDYYHIDKDAVILQRTAPETFEDISQGSNNGTYIPAAIFPDADALSQFYVNGANPFFNQVEQDRLSGVVPVLTLVRHELFLADEGVGALGSSPNLAAFLQHELDIKNLIGANIGESSIVVDYHPAEYAEVPDGNGGRTVQLNDADNMLLTAYSPIDDSFWTEGTTDPPPNALSFGSDKSGDFAAQPLESATSRGFLGVDLNTILNGTSPLGNGNAILEMRSAFAPALGSPYTDLDQPLKRWTATSKFAQAGALGLEKQPLSGPATYRLLLAHKLGGYPQFASFGGSLIASANRIVALQASNPSQPKYDGFGFPIQFVPPSDVTLLGGSPGQSSVSIYLGNAKQAANAAVAAVTIAFTTMLEEEKEQLSVQAQVAKSTAVVNAAQQGLCGQVEQKKCQQDAALTSVPLLSAGMKNTVAQLHAMCAGNDDHAKLGCAAYKIINNYDVGVSLPNAVASVLAQSAQPSFYLYSGGSLQSTFIADWSDYNHITELLNQVLTAYSAADARIGAADAQLGSLNAKIDADCNSGAYVEAMLEGVSVSAGFPSGGSVTMSVGPLIELRKKCADLTTDLAPAISQVVLAAAQSINDMAEEIMRVGDAGAKLQLDIAGGSQQAQQARLATEMAQLDIKLAEGSAATTTQLYRRYHNFDSWRARALVETARRYAVLARRAIESRYVVDLSTLQQPEPLVAAPASWADQVYEYDLNMPSAVGLTIGPQQTTGSIYPNAVVDYVENLQRFVDGYIISRPTTSAQSDSEVISLPGPSGLKGAGAIPPDVIDSSAYRWQFYCPVQAKWVTNATLAVDTVCGSDQPSQARMTFSLDPWGRVGGTVGAPPYQARYNSRWGQLAVNLVGTGILDCTKASDPLTCYSQAFIRYNLAQVGPAWVTDFAEVWHPLNVTKGQIEGAKALAAEQWLDPLANGWSKPFVAAIGRTEFADRPFGGTYELTLQLGPEVTLSRIERLQVLLQSAYWVKQ